MAQTLPINLSYSSKESSWAREILVVLGASLIIGLFAPASIRLPFTVVPIVLQSHVILLLGVLLGSKRAALATLAFLCEGAMGLPVFSGCTAGIARLVGPTGGYLLGWVLGAYVVGLMVEKARERTVKGVFFAMGVGNLVIFLCGLPWLSLFIGVEKAILLGLIPFIAGDFLKIILSLKVLKAIRLFSRS